MKVDILPVGGCLFISLRELGFFTMVPPGINVSYYGNFT